MKDLPNNGQIESHSKEAVSIYATDSASRTIGFSHELSGAAWMRQQAEKSLRYYEWKAEKFYDWSLINGWKRNLTLMLFQKDVDERRYFKTYAELSTSEEFLAYLNSLPQPE